MLLATQERDPDDTPVTAQAPFQVRRQGKTILAARRDSVVRLDGSASSITVKEYIGPTPVVLYRLPYSGA